MKKLVVAALLSVAAMTSFAKGKFLIRGKIDLLTGSKHVRVAGFDPAPIQADGSFEMSGEVKEPGIALIMTDSSGAAAIWLASGEYRIECREIELPNVRSVLFRIPTVKGPADAQLYNDFQNRQFNGFGFSNKSEEDQASKAANKARRREGAIQYMDSIFKTNGSAPVLPEMIRSVQFYAGDEATKSFIKKLGPELRKSREIASVENGLKQKEKIKADKTFENFTLKDVADRNFSLAILAGKRAILIDFWSSSCPPCRMDHRKLKEWYAKYAGRGLQIVSISIDESRSAWLKAIHDDGIRGWINVRDPHGFNAILMQDYYISFIPFRFLLDGKRNIILVNNMEDSWITEKDIEAAVEAGK